MKDSYWAKFTNRRLTRRRALVGAGGAAAAAAFLAACGGDDDDDDDGTPGGGASGGGTNGGGGATPSGGGGGAPAGLITSPSHTPPASATKGGIFKHFAVGEPRSLDPLSGQAGLNSQEDFVYELLLDEKPGFLEPSGYELYGRLAESWEVSGDGLQITFKLRQGVKWHDIAPVSGRDFDSSDVVAALERYASIGSLSTVLYASAGSGGPIQSVTAPDASTVVITQDAPINYTLNYFAPFGGFTATQIITPREANDESQLDVRTQMVGTGPYYLSAHEPSVRFEYKKFAEYWDSENWLVDEILEPIVPEYVSRLAQLQAGEIYMADSYTDILRATDALQLKSDQPDMLLYFGPTNLQTSVFTFGSQGANEYKDERVRQAISMGIDRDLSIEVANNVEEFEAAGIPVERFWNSHLRASDGYRGGGWALNPRDEAEFGENAKYFQYNVAEAKKLLTAAGYPDGFVVPFRYPNTAVFDRAVQVEPYFFYLQELGLTVEQNGQTDYTQDYIPNNRDGSGQYAGIGYHSVTGGVPSLVSPVSAMVAEYWPGSGVTFHGFSADGGTGQNGDPALTEILGKARVESDLEAAKSLILEAQRYLGKAMWAMMEPGGSPGIYAAWPAVQNFQVWRSEPSTERFFQLWLDQTKAPFA